MSVLTAIGLMSGTSLDGVDVALIESDGERESSISALQAIRAYTTAEREVLRAALVGAVGMTDRNVRSPILAEAEKTITAAHVEAVEAFLKANKLDGKSIDIIGFHGQTVLHRPDIELTVQIGDGNALAKALKLPVAYDFRAADTAAGGQGAPLVPRVPSCTRGEFHGSTAARSAEYRGRCQHYLS